MPQQVLELTWKVDECKPLYGGATFLVLASGQVGTPSEGKVFRLDSFVDNDDGTYIGIYTPKYSGAFSLVLKRADEQLQGSPFAVTAWTTGFHSSTSHLKLRRLCHRALYIRH